MKTILPVAVGLGLLLTGVLGCKPHKSDQPVVQVTERMFTHSYRINAGTFVENLKRLAAPQPGESNQQLLVRYFKENNVVIEPPAAVLLDETGNRLLVRAGESKKQPIQTLFDKIQSGR